MSIDAFLEEHKLPDSYREFAQKWFTPLVEQIATHQKGADKPFMLGIHGCQGSGKSTLAAYLAHQLAHLHQLKVVVCSLDDFYLSSEKRSKLAEQVHPLLRTRGVPGTHDVALLEQVLLHANQPNTLSPLAVPRFDKATDNPAPHGQWPVYSMPVDVVILEGWCWGVPAENDDALVNPINDLERDQDTDGVWRRYVNTQIQRYYQPLYGLMDAWVMLKAPSFQQVAAWREEQEQKLRDRYQGSDAKKIMSPQQVLDFITYFQRLTEHALHAMPASCHWVFELNEHRDITHCTESSGDVI